MSEPVARFAALLQLSDKMLERAEHQDLEECIRLLALHVVEYREKHGILSYDNAMDLLSRETIDDAQAKKLADGFEIIVGMLGFLEQARTKH